MQSGLVYQFANCRIIRDHKIVREDLWIRDGKIIRPDGLFFDEKIVSGVMVDCKGCYLFPGFIDLQINGTSFQCLI